MKNNILIRQYLFFCISIFLYILFFSTNIHEFWHFIVAKMFWVDSTIYINDYLYNFLNFNNFNKLNIMGYTSFNVVELNNLNNVQLILIYLAGVVFDILGLWIIIWLFYKFTKNKDLHYLYILIFILYFIFTIYYNLYPMNIDRETQNDWFNIMMIFNR